VIRGSSPLSGARGPDTVNSLRKSGDAQDGERMRVLVWGLGYVGTVSAACLADAGHEVIGVEPNRNKAESINAGRSPVKEPEMSEIIRATTANGMLRAVIDGVRRVAWADVSLICVGTPSGPDGNMLLDYLERVGEQIGCGLKETDRYHVVILRSTVFPGTTYDCLVPILEKYSDRTAGRDFGVVVNPEFMRETSAIADFRHPSWTVIGQTDPRAGDVVADLYAEVDAPVHRVRVEEAEFLKLASNAFHALKIGFANEVGRVCDRLSLDGHSVMDLVCTDTKLNISPAYMKPLFAFGGSCLPKDLRSLALKATQLGVPLPIMNAILPSNALQIDLARLKLHALRAKRVAILGLSFKPYTDDLRESPVIALIHQLWREGLEISVYDPDVVLDQMLGSNLRYMEQQLPQASRVMRSSLEEAVSGCDAMVVTQNRPEFAQVATDLIEQVAVVDLVRLENWESLRARGRYTGIAW
jgi:GDP-mannose 6-dehydrogenase